MKSFRTPEGQAEYDAYRAAKTPDTPCELCAREALRSFKYWKIILNHFPYARIAEMHHMLLPHRHIVERELNQDERAELAMIKESHLGDYKYIMEATPPTKSIPKHLHFHLIAVKDFGAVRDYKGEEAH